MKKLPLDIIREILLRTELDRQLTEFALVCRRFAMVLNSDVLFALEHIRRRFRISMETMKALSCRLAMDLLDDKLCDELVLRVYMLDRHVGYSPLPIAYQAALFALDSHLQISGLYAYSANAKLRVVQCLNEQFLGGDVSWYDSLRHLAQTGHVAALDYVVNNCGRGFNEHSIQEALNSACSYGHVDVVLRLMAVPSLDGGLQLLHEALIVAVCQKWLECVDAILNDPLGRVTQQDRDAALVQCARRTSLPIPALLIQNGVSTQGLNEAFLAAIRYDSPEFASLLLMQPEIEPDYQKGLEEAVNHDNTSIAKLLLDIGEVSIPANDYRALRRALYVGKTNQVILLLEAAQRLKDVEAVRIANEWMDQERGAHFTQTVRAQIQTWADEIKPSGSDSVSFSVEVAHNIPTKQLVHLRRFST